MQRWMTSHYMVPTIDVIEPSIGRSTHIWSIIVGACVILPLVACDGTAGDSHTQILSASSGTPIHLSILDLSQHAQLKGGAAIVQAFAAESGGLLRHPEIAERFAKLSDWEETSLIDLFRDPSLEGLRFPDIEPDCEDKANCISSHPSVVSLVRAPIGAEGMPLLVAGNAEVSSHLKPQAGDLPLTVWQVKEPLKDVIWSGVWQDKKGHSKSFVAQLSGPADLAARRAALQKVVEHLNRSERN